jgi:hypothetical protein
MVLNGFIIIKNKNMIVKYTEDEFDKNFELVKNHIVTNASFDGCLFETFGPEIIFVLEMMQENRVITIIESDSEEETNDSGETSPCMYYTSGFHLFNRIGYLITKEPITQEFEVKLEW